MRPRREIMPSLELLEEIALLSTVAGPLLTPLVDAVPYTYAATDQVLNIPVRALTSDPLTYSLDPTQLLPGLDVRNDGNNASVWWTSPSPDGQLGIFQFGLIATDTVTGQVQSEEGYIAVAAITPTVAASDIVPQTIHAPGGADYPTGLPASTAVTGQPWSLVVPINDPSHDFGTAEVYFGDDAGNPIDPTVDFPVQTDANGNEFITLTHVFALAGVYPGTLEIYSASGPGGEYQDSSSYTPFVVSVTGSPVQPASVSQPDQFLAVHSFGYTPTEGVKVAPVTTPHHKPHAGHSAIHPGSQTELAKLQAELAALEAKLAKLGA